jgi:hypothetical protein
MGLSWNGGDSRGLHEEKKTDPQQANGKAGAQPSPQQEAVQIPHEKNTKKLFQNSTRKIK